LADDHPLVRSGIRAALSREPDLEVLGEAATGEEAVNLCLELPVEVLLLDLGMPGPSPTDVVARLKENCPGTKIIVVTAYDDDTYVRGMIRAGVLGYLLKDEAAETLPAAIRRVTAGGKWFSQSVMDKLIEWGTGGETREGPRLTRREEELLRLLSRGWDNARIAHEMSLAEQTVRNYASRVYEKLGVGSRAEAIVWAKENGIA
jgi:DNA-binding NarL/FixJ family response regulator